PRGRWSGLLVGGHGHRLALLSAAERLADLGDELGREAALLERLVDQQQRMGVVPVRTFGHVGDLVGLSLTGVAPNVSQARARCNPRLRHLEDHPSKAGWKETRSVRGA